MSLAGAMQRHDMLVTAFLDHAARWHPRAGVVSVGEEGTSFTDYAELHRRAARLAAAFAAHGVGHGDTIATLGWNTRGHFDAWYAAAAIGAVCHTLNPRLPAEQLAAMTAASAPRLMLYGTGLGVLAREAVPGVAAVALDGSGADSLDAMVEGAAGPAAGAAVREDDPCGLCFTSGTTGAPKGVTYSHRSNYLHTLRLLGADALALTAADRVLAAVPMFHANGWGLPFAAPAVGATLVLPGRQLDGASLARLIRDEGVTVAAGVPTVWLDLAEHLRAEGGRLPTLRRLYLGGAALPVEAQARLEEALGASVHTSWGMTELSPLGTVAPTGVAATPAGSSGRVPFGLDLRLVDAAGVAVAGSEGHLQARGHGVVARYHGAAAAAVDADGWFDTGDLARIGEDGDLWITGRAKDLIKSGGEWINPVAIEAIVGDLPDVALAAVVARAHPRWGERPVLVVEPAAGRAVDADALLAALDGRIARWWMPDAVVPVDRMPRAATGKIDKAALRRAVADVASAAQL